jgi:hypothetical protein
MQAEILPETMKNLKIKASLCQIGIYSFERQVGILDSHLEGK